MTRQQFYRECREKFGPVVMDNPNTVIKPCSCGRPDCAGWYVQAEATLTRA